VRVLQINKFLYPAGGTETAMFQTADLLRRHGHEVSFFGMQDDRNTAGAPGEYLVSNVDYSGSTAAHGAARFKRWLSAGRILHSQEAARKLEALITEARPDVAHLHNIYHQLSPSILGVLRRHAVPAVLTLHDYKLICPNYMLHTHDAVCERCKGHRYYQAVLQGCVKGSRLNGVICATEAYTNGLTHVYENSIDTFIAPSRFMQRKMAEFGAGAGRIAYIPNFIDVAAFEPRYEAQPYFVFVGRLERVKGVSTLLRAVAASQIASRFELRIAGDGAVRQELERQDATDGRSNVRFLGRLSRDALRDLLQNAMFVVVPSEWYENAPMSVLEAYAYGKPVIGARIGGIPELIEHGETGLLFEPGNTQALQQAIDDMLTHPGLAQQMGRNARRLVEDAFGPQLHYERLMALYTRPRQVDEAGRLLHERTRV
jgi:glycosyltransferase involved in cell wall biosynthesis